MRDASIKVLRRIGVDTGGSNVQFAINHINGEINVIEMNPRVSRSSALASKATGFPIAKIAALLAVGFTLDEIINDITAANAEPSILSLAADYNASVVLMHMKGKPENMQNNPKYRSIMDTLESFFEERIECCLKYNVKLYI